MRRALALIPLAALTTASSDDPLAGRIAGTGERCVSYRQVERLLIADPNTLTLRDGRRLWVSHPEPRCAPLDRFDILVLEPQGAQLCRGDRFRTIRQGLPIPSPTCRLGLFVPYDLPKE